jgi:hypothetical protein
MLLGEPSGPMHRTQESAAQGIWEDEALLLGRSVRERGKSIKRFNGIVCNMGFSGRVKPSNI